MADPITWGLINLVKKGVKGVQTTLDAVSDKVSGLPDSLDTDFTEVKNAISDVKTDTGTNLPQKMDAGITQVRNDIEGVKTYTEQINSSLSLISDSVFLNPGDQSKEIYYTHNGSQSINILNVKGKGVFYGVNCPGGNGSKSITVTIDGKVYELNAASYSEIGIYTPILSILQNETPVFGQNGRYIFLSKPIIFESSLKIDVAGAFNFYGLYDLL